MDIIGRGIFKMEQPLDTPKLRLIAYKSTIKKHRERHHDKARAN
jgi:hypothetical protein